MSRRQAAPAPRPHQAPPPRVPATPRAPQQRSAKANGDGSIVEVSGSLEQMTPMQDQGQENVHVRSPNLSFNDGGDPVRSALVEDELDVPPPARFRVLEDKQISTGGHRFTLRAGKEVDSANYDIALLRRFNVKLEPLDAAG